MFEKIKEHINEVMSKYTDSRQPTDDDVRIAWLVCEIDRLKALIIADRMECHACGEDLIIGEHECRECGAWAKHIRTDKVENA